MGRSTAFPPILSLYKVTYEANSYSIPVPNKATVSVDVKQHFNSYIHFKYSGELYFVHSTSAEGFGT